MNTVRLDVDGHLAHRVHFPSYTTHNTCQTHTTHNRFTVTSVETAAECGLHVVSQAYKKSCSFGLTARGFVDQQ